MSTNEWLRKWKQEFCLGWEAKLTLRGHPEWPLAYSALWRWNLTRQIFPDIWHTSMRQTFNSSPHPIYILLGGHWNAISPSFRKNWIQLELKLAISRFLPGVVGSSQTGAVEQIQFKILPFNGNCYIVHWQVGLDLTPSQLTTDNHSGPMADQPVPGPLSILPAKRIFCS